MKIRVSVRENIAHEKNAKLVDEVLEWGDPKDRRKLAAILTNVFLKDYSVEIHAVYEREPLK